MFDALPLEVVVRLFEQHPHILVSARAVCRAWRDAATILARTNGVTPRLLYFALDTPVETRPRWATRSPEWRRLPTHMWHVVHISRNDDNGDDDDDDDHVSDRERPGDDGSDYERRRQESYRTFRRRQRFVDEIMQLGERSVRLVRRLMRMRAWRAWLYVMLCKTTDAALRGALSEVAPPFGAQDVDRDRGQEEAVRRACEAKNVPLLLALLRAAPHVQCPEMFWMLAHDPDALGAALDIPAFAANLQRSGVAKWVTCVCQETREAIATELRQRGIPTREHLWWFELVEPRFYHLFHHLCSRVARVDSSFYVNGPGREDDVRKICGWMRNRNAFAREYRLAACVNNNGDDLAGVYVPEYIDHGREVYLDVDGNTVVALSTGALRDHELAGARSSGFTPIPPLYRQQSFAKVVRRLDVPPAPWAPPASMLTYKRVAASDLHEQVNVLTSFCESRWHRRSEIFADYIARGPDSDSEPSLAVVRVNDPTGRRAGYLCLDTWFGLKSAFFVACECDYRTPTGDYLRWRSMLLHDVRAVARVVGTPAMLCTGELVDDVTAPFDDEWSTVEHRANTARLAKHVDDPLRAAVLMREIFGHPVEELPVLHFGARLVVDAWTDFQQRGRWTYDVLRRIISAVESKPHRNNHTVCRQLERDKQQCTTRPNNVDMSVAQYISAYVEILF